MRAGSMRWTLVVATAIAGIVAAVAAELAAEEPAAPKPDGRFAVHEWGTFTSIAGADGVALEGLSREEEALPSFVYSRSKVRACPLRGKGWKGLEVPADHVTQKMETPVLYFHSATARRVRVRVDFVKGLISQWYPVSDLLGPPEGACEAGPLDISKVERSFLEWDVELSPRGAAAPAEVPAVGATDPWNFARDVDASWVRTTPRKAPDRAGPVEAERYLFYRGLGNFPLPLTATAARDGQFTLRNAGDAPIPPAIVMQIEGSRGQILDVPVIPAHGEVSVALRDCGGWGPIDDVEEKLKALVERRLVATGLADDEARAMVRTWSRSWFRCEGTRVLWMLPRHDVDALLPLSIDPKPDDLVRVLVGRTEIITPEVAAEVEAAIRDCCSDDSHAKTAATARLGRLGRFLEPHARNVLARTKDDLVRTNAQTILAELRTSEEAR